MLTFNKKFLFLAVFLFVIEVLIALYVQDKIIRPYAGDYLVVIFLYCLVQSVVKAPVVTVAAGVLLFSFLVETLQYFHFVAWLGLQHNAIATVILGNHFEWTDMFAYTLGILTVLGLNKIGDRYFSKDNE